MIKTQKSSDWDVPENEAVEMCAASRLGKYFGSYFWIITDSVIPNKKHMLATELTSEAVNCHECKFKKGCKYGKTLVGPMITIEEMVAKRNNSTTDAIFSAISFFYQVKNLEVGKIESICKSFSRDCKSCPLAIHKSECYTNNNHLCITGMNLYTFLSELDNYSAYFSQT